MKRRSWWSTTAATLMVALLCSVGASPTHADARARNDDVVNTEGGLVRGRVTTEHRIFEGVPYAAPPKGQLRWSAPQPVQPWTGIRDATSPGSPCPQLPSQISPISSEEEDCLFVNVTVPRGGDPAAKPVMVWIHGDGAVGAGHFFDPRRLTADGDVIVVTVNYRLGLFGGFGLPGLQGSGTFQLQDQQAAMRWVRSNIAAFGGDPRNVTLFGVSYGATATSAHLTAPQSRGLFDRAILESGFALMNMLPESIAPGSPGLPWWAWRTELETDQTGLTVARELGCGQVDPAAVLACMRALPVKTLLGYPQVMQIFQQMAYGGSTLPELPALALRGGRFHQMPIMAGGTRDEHRTWVGLLRDGIGQPVTADQYPTLLAKAFGLQNVPAIEQRYPLNNAETPSITWATVLTDATWARRTQELNELFAAKMPTYAYEFADRNAPSYLPFPPGFPAGAYHAADTPYTFRDAKFTESATPEQIALSDKMIKYWGNFARNGHPNGTGVPTWPEFDANSPTVQSLAPEQIGPIDYATAHKYDFWRRSSA